MPEIKIPVSAQLNAADLDAQLSALKQKINEVGAAIAQANRVSFQPIAKATLQDLDRVTRQFEALKRGAPNVAKAIEGSGQSNRSFFDLDWERMFSNSIAREAARYGAFTKVMAGTGATFAQPAVPSSPGASPVPAGASPGSGPIPSRSASRPASQRWNGQYRNPWNHTRVGGIVTAGLNAAGPLGGVASGALNSAYVGGGGSFLSGGALMAGLGGLIGGGLALGLSKAIGAVANKIGDAQQENIAADTLKRTLGDTNVSFEALKEGLRAASGSISTTFNETERLGMSFAKLGNVTERQYGELAQEVASAGGFSRSFGLEPSQGVQFFAQMRGLSLTRDVADSQRLGLVIGETIAKSGAFAQSDRVLQALAGFAAQQTRLGLTPANIAGYGGVLAGLVNSGTPGLDVSGSASVLDRANSAIQNGGGAGPAGQNFLYSALGQRLGLDPIQTQMLQEQGAFGTGAAEFGPNSAFARWARDNHVPIPQAAAASTQTSLSMIMGRMRQIYSGGGVMSELRVNAESNLLHLNNSQAMALDYLYGHGGPQNVDGTLQRLKRLGISLNSVNATGISRLAQIDANGNLTDAQKDAQFRAVASQAQEKTPGSDVRDSVVGVQNVLQSYADKAVPLMTASRDALLFLAGKGAGHMMSPEDIHNAVLSGQRKTIDDKADERISAARSAFVNASATDDYGRPIDPKGQQAAYDNLQAVTKSANDERAAGLAQINASDLQISPTLASRAGDDAVRAALADQQKYGVPAAVTLAQYALESNYGKTGLAKRSNNPFSVQYNGKDGRDGVDYVTSWDTHADGTRYLAKFKKYKSVADAFDDHARLLSNDKHYAEARKHLNDPAAYADALTGVYAEDPNYGAKLKSLMGTGMYDFKMPDNASVPKSQTQQHLIMGEFTLKHPDGKPAAAPITVTKQVGPPQPAGVN